MKDEIGDFSILMGLIFVVSLIVICLDLFIWRP